MPRLQYKPFASPDHERTFPHGSAQVVTLDDATIGLARWEPGWRWSTHLAPIAGTASCQVHHLGYAISGRLHVVMDDGQSLEIPGGSAYEIPSGHDASVVGDEAFVTLEWTSAHVVGVDRGRARSGSWPRCCSPTSSARPRRSRRWATRAGVTSSASTTGGSATC